MAPEEYQRVRALFASVASLSPEERHKWLADSESGEQRQTVGWVRRMLEESPERDAFLEAGAASMFETAHGLASGTRIDRYVVDLFLGSGGFADVYLAHDDREGGTVVIKVLRRLVATGEWEERKFRQEREALDRVHHPGVVGVVSAGELDCGRPFLILEYVPGQTLRQALEKPMEWPRCSAVLGQIADALDAAHACGVVHRDLKPENVILRPEEVAENAQ